MKNFKKILADNDLATRLWSKDVTLWSADPDVQKSIQNRLGWLDVVDWIFPQVDELIDWAGSIAEANKFNRVVVIGMGGSSLAPEVFSQLFEPVEGYPVLEVLDSTSPEMVDEVLTNGIEQTLFIVASKSGTTLETTDLYRFFFDQVASFNQTPGSQFIAITDGGSWLESHAAEQGFLRTFVNPSDIGGRYSALSYFGLVPAALYGVNVKTLLERTIVMLKTARSDISDENPCLNLGVQMAQHALSGRDKMMLLIAEPLSTIGAWIEQLVAESTGKQGVGILPVCITHPEDMPEHYPEAADGFNVALIENLPDAVPEESALHLSLESPLDIGAEFFRWEFATAIAAVGLAVNPFDEPNVSEAKQSTNSFIQNGRELDLQLTGDATDFSISALDASIVEGDGVGFAGKLSANSYVAILAYLPMTEEDIAQLEQLRFQVACYYDVVCTAGFGPRYLHSTGQLHKGGAATGAFIQIVGESKVDHAVPGRDYGFAKLIRAQADGDFSVLSEKGLPVMRFVLKGDRLQSLGALASVFADMA